MKAREGDLIETQDNNIFDVKGTVHPPGRIVAFIRFTPSPEGEREKGKKAYRKVYPLKDRYELLQERFPQYLVYDRAFDEWLCEVPIKEVKHHYKPEEHLRKLRGKTKLSTLEAAALNFAELLKKTSAIPWNKLGVSGSLLTGLSTPNSDVDLVVYGSQNCYRVYDALKALISNERSQVKAYSNSELRRLFDFRSKDTAVAFEDFVRTESRKVLQGTFQGRDYFIRCLKDWNETTERYGDFHYRSIGYGTVKVMVTDDSQMIFTPCRYKIGKVKVVEGEAFEPMQEIVSFRGRFCEQARNGEGVTAQGKIEMVSRGDAETYYRLLLGNRVSDYMILTK